MSFVQIAAAPVLDKPVEIHWLTMENVLFFFKMFWLVNRALWQVWAWPSSQ